MGRHIRSNLPTSPTSLKPEWPDLQTYRTRDSSYKIKQKKQYDRRHCARDLLLIDEETQVFVTNGRDSNAMPGSIAHQATQRSYVVDTPSGTTRRNRCHINIRANEPNDATVVPRSSPTVSTDNAPQTSRSPTATQLRTGTAINPPDRLVYGKGDVVYGHKLCLYLDNHMIVLYD